MLLLLQPPLLNLATHNRPRAERAVARAVRAAATASSRAASSTSGRRALLAPRQGRLRASSTVSDPRFSCAPAGCWGVYGNAFSIFPPRFGYVFIVAPCAKMHSLCSITHAAAGHPPTLSRSRVEGQKSVVFPSVGLYIIYSPYPDSWTSATPVGCICRPKSLLHVDSCSHTLSRAPTFTSQVA